jgi:MauM/NapG family ferredoxin protein
VTARREEWGAGDGETGRRGDGETGEAISVGGPTVSSRPNPPAPGRPNPPAPFPTREGGEDSTPRAVGEGSPLPVGEGSGEGLARGGAVGDGDAQHSEPSTQTSSPVPSLLGELGAGWARSTRQFNMMPEPWPPTSRFYRLVWGRRAVQAVALLLFLYLATSARYPLQSPLPVDLFLRLDPLAQISSSLAARELSPHLLWALPLLVATALIGRFFCGWLCPMGTTLDLMRLRHNNRPRLQRENAARGLKYLLLAAIGVAAFAGSTVLMPFDPITLLTRSFAIYIYPAFNAVVTATISTLYDRGILQDQMVWIDTSLRGNLLPMDQPFFRLSWVFLVIFAGTVGLNVVAHRFWCRYLCPLGAMLSLLSRTSLVGRRVSTDCVACGKCQASCRMGAVEPKSFAADVGECVLCGECRSLCPDAAVSYGAKTVATSRYDPSRRSFLAAGGMAVLGVAGLRADSPSREVNPFLVRPPGARAEADFLQRCIRCGECMKACPSSGLQPSLLQSGMEGLWTPVLVSRVGPCLFDCTTCGQVCPTSAIKPLELEVKRQTIIGTAYIDQKRCLPWADGRNCIVCQEMCPVSPKAVLLDEVEVTRDDAERVTVKRPRIVRSRCIGCGICEKKCPLPGEAAIRVYNTSSMLSETGDVTG